MDTLKLSCALLVLFGLVCAGNGNVISSLLGKRSDDTAEADDKTAVSAAATPAAKTAREAATTTTTTSDPGTSCGGLKGFLHICDKNEPSDPPKTVKTRSVSKDSDEDSDSDSDSSDSDDSDEKLARKPSVNATEKAISKRQAEDPETLDAPEEPPMVDAGLPQPEEDSSEDAATKKRQTDDSDSSEETEEDKRRRRDCRDRIGDYDKDCRRKRESQP